METSILLNTVAGPLTIESWLQFTFPMLGCNWRLKTVDGLEIVKEPWAVAKNGFELLTIFLFSSVFRQWTRVCPTAIALILTCCWVNPILSLVLEFSCIIFPLITPEF
jgi:hypothetical protein